MILPEGKFNVILADPPWRFRTWNDDNQKKSALAHYDLMTLEQIEALPIVDVAARDCALFLWTINPMLPHALRVIERWGFTFKTVAFTWAKQTTTGKKWHIGLGYWNRQNTEQCLLATRGKPKRLSKSVRQLLVAPRREHSRKPDEVYDRIQALVAGPYLELFARQQWPGWTAWGNQTDKFEAPGSPSLPPPIPVRPAGDDPHLPLRESRDGRPEGRGPDGQAGSRDEPARSATGAPLAAARG